MFLSGEAGPLRPSRSFTFMDGGSGYFLRQLQKTSQGHTIRTSLTLYLHLVTNHVSFRNSSTYTFQYNNIVHIGHCHIFHLSYFIVYKRVILIIQSLRLELGKLLGKLTNVVSACVCIALVNATRKLSFTATCLVVSVTAQLLSQQGVCDQSSSSLLVWHSLTTASSRTLAPIETISELHFNQENLFRR